MPTAPKGWKLGKYYVWGKLLKGRKPPVIFLNAEQAQTLLKPKPPKPQISADEQAVNELVKSGELKVLRDGFGNFGGYEDEAGHIHSSVKELKDEGVI